MSLKTINKKIASKEAKIQWSMEKLLKDKDSVIFCDNCKNRLGIFYMIRQSFFKKKGEKYLVPCRSCKTINLRIKGKLSSDIDKDWDEFGF